MGESEWNGNLRTEIKAKNKKDGYRQRNVRQFLHSLVSPGYTPGTIAVNATWMERGFNAGQMHIEAYTHLFSTVYEL